MVAIEIGALAVEDLAWRRNAEGVASDYFFEGVHEGREPQESDSYDEPRMWG